MRNAVLNRTLKRVTFEQKLRAGESEQMKPVRAEALA